MMKMVLMDFLPAATATGVIGTAIKYGPKVWNFVKGLIDNHRSESQDNVTNATSIVHPKPRMTSGALSAGGTAQKILI